MTMTNVIWHGTRQESSDLATALAHNCGCRFGLMGVRLSTYAGHAMLTGDQRAMDGLVFERWLCATRFPGAGNRCIPLTP